MKRKRFNISMKPQIESGEYQVVMRDSDKPVRIICWDADPKYPICYLEETSSQVLPVMVGPNGSFYENPEDADEQESRADLFVLIPDDKYPKEKLTTRRAILTREISARGPYGLKVYCQDFKDPKITTCVKYNNQNNFDNSYVFLDGEPCYYDILLVKPYLRPLSDMTDAEWSELDEEIIKAGGIGYNYQYNDAGAIIYIDFMLRHHFDYHGLIDMGLAIKAPKGMYNLEKK